MMENTNEWPGTNWEETVQDMEVISQISPRVFLSGIKPLERSPELLKRLGITHILSCVDRKHIGMIQDKILRMDPSITILSLPYRDENTQSLWVPNRGLASLSKSVSGKEELARLQRQIVSYRNKPLIEVGYRFIDSALQEGGKVLVHCMAGISRSSSALIYYMMKKNNEDFQEALQRLRKNRSIVCPNNSFCLQLMRYQIIRQAYTEDDSRAVIDYLESARSGKRQRTREGQMINLLDRESVSEPGKVR